jgi:hypothetical protein
VKDPKSQVTTELDVSFGILENWDFDIPVDKEFGLFT